MASQMSILVSVDDDHAILPWERQEIAPVLAEYGVSIDHANFEQGGEQDWWGGPSCYWDEWRWPLPSGAELVLRAEQNGEWTAPGEHIPASDGLILTIETVP